LLFLNRCSLRKNSLDLNYKVDIHIPQVSIKNKMTLKDQKLPGGAYMIFLKGVLNPNFQPFRKKLELRKN